MIQKTLNIEDTGTDCKDYIKGRLKEAWNELRKVQENSKDKREEHMKVLAEHYAERRNTTKVIEINKILTYENIRKTAAKHKWYLKERNGMIRTLLVPDYKIY